MSPTTGLVSGAYNTFIYRQLEILPIIFYTLFGIAGLTIILGLIDKYNLVAAEMIGVLQLIYFGSAIAG